MGKQAEPQSVRPCWTTACTFLTLVARPHLSEEQHLPPGPLAVVAEPRMTGRRVDDCDLGEEVTEGQAGVLNLGSSEVPGGAGSGDSCQMPAV